MDRLYNFRKNLADLSCIHDKNVRDHSLLPKRNEYEITDGAVICIPQNSGAVLRTAVKDFIDYMLVSQNVGLRISNQTEGDISFELKTEEKLSDKKKNAYSVYVGNGVRISGYSEKGLAQALYKLEFEMNVRKAPFLKKGNTDYSPLFSPRMVHSALGLDVFPDGYLARLAHSGIDAIIFFIKDAIDACGGDRDLNEICGRAADYGIGVYVYSRIRSEAHPDDKNAEAFYEDRYGKIFKTCPSLSGVILVGESIMFPSKDPDTSGKIEFLTSPHEIPAAKPNPGWWPCEDYPKLVSLIKKIINKYSPDAETVFWTYNWGYAPEEERIKLIKSLPSDITLLTTFEMFEKFKIGNSDAYCADYTLSFPGPGKYFLSEAEAAFKRGIKLYSMSNTAGKTWDFGCVPFEPMPYQWIKRINALKDSAKKFNLCGLMECHTYGLYPSFISDIANLSFSMPDSDCEKILSKVLTARFGRDNVSVLKNALKQWSKAINFYTPTNEDQYGAFRIGPAYPFNFQKKFLPEPNTKNASVEGMVMPDYEFPYVDFSLPPSLRIKDEIQRLEKMKSLIDSGIKIMEENRRSKNEEYVKLLNIGKYISHTVQTGINAKKWHILKTAIICESKKEKILSLIKEARSLLKAEYENAEATIPIVSSDSSLGFEPSMDYLGDAKHIEWKLSQIKYVLDVELENFEKRVEFKLF